MGVRNISWVFFGLMALMVPPVLLINGFVHHSWTDAALFALSVAVGLTPEMLPMIVNSNLARGAYLMSKKRCIVKNLDAIINLGSMDVLCTDKTGTLTENKVILVRHLDDHGKASIQSLQLAFLNSRFQTGLKNLLDVAVVEYFEKTASELPMYDKAVAVPSPTTTTSGKEIGSGLTAAAVTFAARYKKLDEVPFDFVRRRMSVVLKDISDDQAILVSKGAVEEMLSICTKIVIPCQQNPDSVDIQMAAVEGQTIPALDSLVRTNNHEIQTLTPEMVAHLTEMNKDLNIDGLRVVAVAYRDLDKVKSDYGILDECNMIFAGLIGFLDPPKESTGPAIKELLSLGVEVKVLTGDSAAVCRKVCQEIGLPVKSIVTTDDMSLMVIADSVLMGRTTYGNTMKYIVMAISSNFGNVFSMLVASSWLPFLPMQPIHILTQNLLYDISQTTIPWDKMDNEFLMVPHRWNIRSILRFMVFMGPWSSIFDITTYLFMWFYFGIQSADDSAGVTLFQTAWFTEGALTQLLVIHIIRSPKIPFVQTVAAYPVIASSLIISVIVLVLPYIGVFRELLTMVELPGVFYGYLVGALSCYFVVTQLAKMVYLRTFNAWF
ncbi:hypothetical protein BGX29_005576 [Mortierella sp. GBA35]|nr:hypothetical protein BGX29_005576 [Mortierella sp. GBA35]